jgi:hypothetical protein
MPVFTMRRAPQGALLVSGGRQAKRFDQIDERLRAFIDEQPILSLACRALRNMTSINALPTGLCERRAAR